MYKVLLGRIIYRAWSQAPPPALKMARLNAKLCLAATCLLFVCTAGASPAGDDVAEEDIEAQIAKLELEKQLLDKKIATARKGRAAPAQPSLTTEDGFVRVRLLCAFVCGEGPGHAVPVRPGPSGSTQKRAGCASALRVRS